MLSEYFEMFPIILKCFALMSLLIKKLWLWAPHLEHNLLLILLTNIQTGGQRDKKADKKTNRQPIDRQTDKCTSRQIDSQTDNLTDR